MLRYVLCCLLCLLGSAGCGRAPRSATARHDLSHLAAADRFAVFSLDPKSGPESWHNQPEMDGRFHGYRIIGATDVDAGPERVRLLEALRDGLNRGPGPLGGAGCFFPRHGLRVLVGGAPTDYLICFECSWVHVYAGGPASNMTISPAPKATFDRYLEGRGVPLPPPL